MSSFSSSHIVLYSLLHLIRKHFAQIFNFGTFAVVMTIFLNSHVSQPTPSTSLMVPSVFFNNNYYLFIFVVWKISHHCASYIFVPAMILLDVLSELDMEMECMSEFSPVRDTDVEDNKGVLFVCFLLHILSCLSPPWMSISWCPIREAICWQWHKLCCCNPQIQILNDILSVFREHNKSIQS